MPEILKINAERSEDDVLTRAAGIVVRGGVIAYPTETIYGLGADATNEQAINRIYDIKGRDFNNPVSVIIGEARDLYPLVREISASAQKLMDAFWPGPLTIIFEAADGVSPLLTAGTGKIGIRLSGHHGARQIALKAGKPLTATSANLAGAPECVDAKAVLDQIGDKIDAVVDLGKTAGAPASTIIDVTGLKAVILRAGGITREKIIRKTGLNLA